MHLMIFVEIEEIFREDIGAQKKRNATTTSKEILLKEILCNFCTQVLNDYM